MKLIGTTLFGAALCSAAALAPNGAFAHDDHLMLSLTACVSQSAQQTIHMSRAFVMERIREGVAKDCAGIISNLAARDGDEKTAAAIAYIGKGVALMHDKGNPQFDP
ncbi:MAG TPA: hypothetical protein VKV96_10805 [Roseiarcus sp.]|nr:hypothetical protein [Roseiarcus sp.]